ncbi:PIN domain-like protein [Ephemerocybe angulata]|uniref:PIN domain-like protein n=1 Tax=Ephemerocybe angulata TaxID=980116 RepID=A0A8H6M9E0_9AGAR|nr:PIN domain-like protein [Tulosesus angulatus]
MFAAKFATKKKGESINSWTRIGQETELANLRKNLEQWLTLPAIFVVVFDGPRRPKTKRGKQVRTSRPHQLEPAFREMVEAMGFHCEMAPGEAEAHLAMLNQSGAVDYILTSDNDAFVFGARNVIRLPRDNNNRDRVEVYTDAALLAHPFGPLTREGLVLIAMLSKGDYANGIEGCGIKFAWRLASTTTLATKLCDIILKRNYSGVDVPAELYRWRTVLRSEIARGTGRGRKPALAAKIPDSFPSADIVGQYVSPAVGSSEAPIPNWVVRYPDSARAAHLAAATFQLGWTGTINFLREFVWVGYMLRHFLMVCCSISINSSTVLMVYYLIHRDTGAGQRQADHVPTASV